MKVLKVFIIFSLIFFSKKISKSFEIINLASINNKIITNIDLMQEIKIRELLESKKIEKSDHNLILQQMIGNKIKRIETENSKIKVPAVIINKQYEAIKRDKFKEKKISLEFQKLIILKIEDTYKWNKLISINYNNKLVINIDEIDEIMKSKKIPENKRDQIINIERNKKLNIFSKTHFNKIKKKYLVKKYL